MPISWRKFLSFESAKEIVFSLACGGKFSESDENVKCFKREEITMGKGRNLVFRTESKVALC